MSCTTCGPSKYSPEYYKPQKPENHAGCCGKCCPASSDQTDKKKVVRCCVVRYRAPY